MANEALVNPLSTVGLPNLSKNSQNEFCIEEINGVLYLVKIINGYVPESDEIKITTSSIPLNIPDFMRHVRRFADLNLCMDYPYIYGKFLHDDRILVWLIHRTGDSFGSIAEDNLIFLRDIGKKVKSYLNRSGIRHVSSLNISKKHGGVHLDVMTHQKTGPLKSIVKKKRLPCMSNMNEM